MLVCCKIFQFWCILWKSLNGCKKIFISTVFFSFELKILTQKGGVTVLIQVHFLVSIFQTFYQDQLRTSCIVSHYLCGLVITIHLCKSRLLVSPAVLDFVEISVLLMIMRWLEFGLKKKKKRFFFLYLGAFKNVPSNKNT